MEKHSLTESLKSIETKINIAKIDLKAINSKLEAAYAYEDELKIRQVAANKSTEEWRKDFFQKSNEITSMYNQMKDIFDKFAGNFTNK